MNEYPLYLLYLTPNLFCFNLTTASCFFTSFLAVELPESERLVLSLSCHQDRPFMWKNTYFECLSSGKHFLEQVLVSPVHQFAMLPC